MLILSPDATVLRQTAGPHPDIPVFSAPLLFDPDSARRFLARLTDPASAIARLAEVARDGTAHNGAARTDAAIAWLVTRRVLIHRAVPAGQKLQFEVRAARLNAAAAIRMPGPAETRQFLRQGITLKSLPDALRSALSNAAAIGWTTSGQRHPETEAAALDRATSLLARAALLLAVNPRDPRTLRLAWRMPSSALAAPVPAQPAADPNDGARTSPRGAPPPSSAVAPPPPPVLPPAIDAASPQAAALLQAANDGTPFVEVCTPDLAKAAA